MTMKPDPSTPGLLAPFSITAGGRFAVASERDHVEQCIRLILGTRPGERRMRPEFGCALHDWFFAPNTPYTRHRIQQAIEQAVTGLEPRIEDLDVQAVPDPRDPERINIRLRYRLRDAATIESLDYPVQLQRE